jgi:transcription termination/antitermination protein NusG
MSDNDQAQLNTPQDDTQVTTDVSPDEPTSVEDSNLPVEEAGQIEAPKEPIESENTEEEKSEEATEETTPEPAVSEDTDTPADQPTKNTPIAATTVDSPGRWYVVHTYSGHENKVAATLKQRIESEHLENKILDVLVPMQDKIEIKGGKKTEVKEKIFPGYILVKMILDDNTWLAVRTTQGVTSFVGIGNKPTPISETEVQSIIKFTEIQHPTFKQIFTVDDTIKIVDGPFSDFIGKVESVDEEKGKVRVLVSIFGRETPVELDFLQVQKI